MFSIQNFKLTFSIQVFPKNSIYFKPNLSEDMKNKGKKKKTKKERIKNKKRKQR